MNTLTKWLSNIVFLYVISQPLHAEYPNLTVTLVNDSYSVLKLLYDQEPTWWLQSPADIVNALAINTVESKPNGMNCIVDLKYRYYSLSEDNQEGYCELYLYRHWPFCSAGATTTCTANTKLTAEVYTEKGDSTSFLWVLKRKATKNIMLELPAQNS